MIAHHTNNALRVRASPPWGRTKAVKLTRVSAKALVVRMVVGSSHRVLDRSGYLADQR
jgi:hypothetical protein